jgi:hypothetical protein
MGYTGEKASLNQYTDLYNYCSEHVRQELKSLINFGLSQEHEIGIRDLKVVHTPSEVLKSVPLASFDGGMASLFQGEIAEICLIKVAGAAPPDHEEFYEPDAFKDLIFHTFIGKLLNAKVLGQSEEEILDSEITRLFDVPAFTEAMRVLGLSHEVFKNEFKRLIGKWKDKTSLKDSIRELLEWTLVLNFMYDEQKRSPHSTKLLPYLIIKDGNIYPHPHSVTGTFLGKLNELLVGNNPNVRIPYVVGALKTSRFTGESIIGRIVKSYSKTLNKRCFFKIPAKYEAMADKDFKDKPYERYFFSIFGDEHIYEIQIPKALIAKGQDTVDLILDTIAAQSTYLYGGSISTNSYAHIAASLSEAESKFLEQTLQSEIVEEIKNERKKS